MGSLETFNLRWNAFEANTRKTLKEFRGEAEFLDVTVVVGDDQQVRANKLVLAGGSSFFHKILRENPHPHPLIYLKGVSYEHLMSLVDFVYTGETNIAQEDLDQFLDTAKELGVKGLVENDTSGEIFDKQTKSRPSIAGSQDQVTSTKTLPSSKVSHSRKVLNPQSKNTFSKSTCQDDSSVAKHSNKAERYDDDDDQVKNERTTNNVVLDVEYQNEKEQAILAGKNLNDIYDTELYKEEGENKEMVHSNCVMEDAEATVCGVKNDWYGWEEENDANNVFPYEEQNKAFSLGKKCYQCSYCNKTFARMDKLKRHIMVHTGEKPFQCSVCSKTFSRQDQLQLHNRIHTGEKPFQCSVCFKMFTRQDHLRVHNRIHTGEKRYQCDFCFKMFLEKSSLDQHMKTNECSSKT